MMMQKWFIQSLREGAQGNPPKAPQRLGLRVSNF